MSGRATGILRERGTFSPFARRFLLPVQAFIHTAGAGGLVLLAAALVALAWANSPVGHLYEVAWAIDFTAHVGDLSLHVPLRETVNSGLMTLFFFLMGLEVKRELLRGELSELRQAMLPLAAAVGGMIVPVALYLLLNASGPGRAGWGVPMATDIAFALGVLALLGPRIPHQLRAVLLALAVADDIGSVLVIALFYAGHVAVPSLLVAGVLLLVVVGLRRLGVRSSGPYWVAGVGVWLALHASGIHATLAGVALGLLTPASAPYGRRSVHERLDPLLARLDRAHAAEDDEEAEMVLGHVLEVVRDTEPPLDRMERIVLPWVSFVVLPLFALANAGIPISAEAVRRAVSSPVARGIVLGLVIGKPAGIVLFSWLALRAGLARLPAGVDLRHLLGAGLLAGIGFTVSLFIAPLAFEGPAVATARLAILAASVAAGSVGWLYLRAVPGTSVSTASAAPDTASSENASGK